MHAWLWKLLAGRKAAAPPQTRRRLELETLEDRLTPTVTYHGGALLPHVEVQALYLGSDWVKNATYAAQARRFDAFLSNVVDSSYMDALTKAGYGVGRGTASAGAYDPRLIDRSVMLTDGAIRVNLQQAISTGLVQTPTDNRMYVVFVQPNTPVGLSDGESSRRDFLGYHAAFAGTDRAGEPADIRYAVVPYPGGTIGNLGVPRLSAFDSMTEVASHEITETAIDPDANYGALGWYDDELDTEPADITNLQYVNLNGYVVQRVADKNGQAMTPAGAAPLRAVTFTLLSNGQFYAHSAAGWTYLASGVASVSSQAIDNQARAMVDVVLTRGDAYEYHDGIGWIFLRHNVKTAVAGHGVSYVLLGDGRLYEYRDETASWSGPLATGITSIDAGTDRYGVNTVATVSTSGVFAQVSDSTGRRPLCSNVQAVSAGSGGASLVLLNDGRAFAYAETTGMWTFLSGGIVQLSAGTDIDGTALFVVVDTGGTASQYMRGAGLKTLGSAVSAVGKARAGVVDVVFKNGNAYEHTPSGWTALTATVRQVS